MMVLLGDVGAHWVAECRDGIGGCQFRTSFTKQRQPQRRREPKGTLPEFCPRDFTPLQCAPMTLDEQLDFLGKGTVDFIERKD